MNDFLFHRLPFTFKPERLRADLERCRKKAWVDHYNQSDYQGDWKVIALRAIGGFSEVIYSVPNGVYQDTPLLKNCPYFQQLLTTFQCPLESVRLMRLAGNSEIKEHCDDHLGYYDGSFRLHIPLVTHPKVTFYFKGRAVNMEVGSCWLANFNEPHRVVNAGADERIHLVIDGKRNAWTDKNFRLLEMERIFCKKNKNN